MLDLKFIRDNVELVQKAMADRQEIVPLNEILEFESERRYKLLELENLRHQRKEAAREKNADQTAVVSGRDLRAMIREHEEAVRVLDERIDDLLLQLPNIPHPTTPVG
jgi:seryl-tRNA synthetase